MTLPTLPIGQHNQQLSVDHHKGARKTTTRASCRGSRPSWSRIGAGCSNWMQAAQGHNMTPDYTVNLHWCSERYEGLHTSRINTTLFIHQTLLPHPLTPPTCHTYSPHPPITPTYSTHLPHPLTWSTGSPIATSLVVVLARIIPLVLWPMHLPTTLVRDARSHG